MTYCEKVSFVTVDEQYHLQRIDNFLKVYLKGLPKTRIYRLIRKGEVRINKKRIKPEYKLQLGDEVRIPPVRLEAREAPPIPQKLNHIQQLNERILYEDEALLVINKPAGMAVHGGSGVQFGLIEALRALRPDARFLELVHRLDRDTSGCLMIAKKRSALRQMHEDLRMKRMRKSYHALVYGVWPKKTRCVNAPLRKQVLGSGERIVRVDPVEGKESQTHYRILQGFENVTLVEAQPITGRTHQIRVHCQYMGHPIVGDAKYSRRTDEQALGICKIKRLFLHAHELVFQHPLNRDQKIRTVAEREPLLQQMLDSFTERSG